MGKTVVVYWSGTGNTEMMAKAIHESALTNDSNAKLFEVSSVSAADMTEYDNLILGCPAMGAEVLEECEFEPFFTELEGNIKNKNVALFGSYGWGDGEWMRDWCERVKKSGANLVNDEGLMVNGEPDDDGLDQCKKLGDEVSKL